MKTRILVVITDLALGGTPRSVESLVLGLDRTRFETHVVTLLEPSPITRNLDAAGIPCLALGMKSKLDPTRLVPLARLVRRGRFDIVHTWLFHANLVGRALRALARFRLIASERGVEATKSRLRVLLDRWTARLSDLIVVNAEAIRDVLVTRERIRPDAIRVIPNGVDLTRFVPSPTRPDGPPRLICVARLDPIKAHGDLIAVLPGLIAAHPGLSLDLVGEGPMRPAIEKQIESLGISGSVRLLGARTDVPDLLGAADLFVLPSLSEGMPGSVLEAMAMALPVVATRAGGTGEIVVDRTTGLLVEPGDRAGLAAALGALAADRERARALGRAGLSRVHQRYTRSAFIQAHERLYDEVAAR